MEDSIAEKIYRAAQELLEAVRNSDANIAEHLNSILNQFLTWPFRAGTACIIDSEGKNITFDTVIYANSETKSKDKPIKPNIDTVSCAVHVIKNLGKEEISEGYESIAAFKRLKRTQTPEVEFPINYTPLGIIFAVDSTMKIEEIADFMVQQNKNYPSTEWPDMVVVLAKGTVNYAVQFHGESIKGDFVLSGHGSSEIMPPPAYIHIFLRGLGLNSLNRMCALLFMHLQTFSPGTKLPHMDDILKGVPPFGMTRGAYQFNLSKQLIPVPDEAYEGRRLPPVPFRIEDIKGNLLAHLQFIAWQDGGVVRLIGKLPLEGLLVFLGPKAKNAHIIPQQEGAISSVLPIGEKEFRELLRRIQRQTNMNVKAEKPKWIASKMADEGTTSPFIARLFLGILRLRDVIVLDDEKREEFDKAYNVVVMTLYNARTTAKEIIETLTEHSRKVSQGEIARLNGNIIRIDESIDNKLRKQVEEFLNSTVRVLKDGMQRLLETLDLDISFLYKKQSTFERQVEEIAQTKPELAEYLKDTRNWSERLILKRNELHTSWMLPKMRYKESSGIIEVEEPQISGQTVSEFVHSMLDRLCCFVEEISVYAIQAKMPPGISLTEIPVLERNKDCPLRFQVTFVNGGMANWTINYHTSKFEET